MTWTLLHARVHQTCRQRKLLLRGERVLVAVSAGQDSLCLLELLLNLQPKWDWQLGVAHCNHGWATDEGIAARVEEVARASNLPFYLKAARDLAETEAAAREWRYRALLEMAREEGFSAIATGHTLSDRAETFLYNLLRGAGTDGLSALVWQRSLAEDIRLVRPLLNVTRAETGEFCQQFQLPIWDDAMNHSLRFARNRLRQETIPHLKADFNPQVETAIAQTAEVLRAEADYLEAIASEQFQAALTATGALNRRKMRSLPLALQRRVVRKFLQQTFDIAPNFQQIEAVTRLIDAPNRSRTSSLSGGVVMEVRGDLLGNFTPND